MEVVRGQFFLVGTSPGGKAIISMDSLYITDVLIGLLILLLALAVVC